MDKRPHILLVEDNEHDIELTMLAFNKSRVANRVDIVKDGAAALDYLLMREAHEYRRGEADPAVVLLDIQLPRLDGLQVLQEIRSSPEIRHIPVVMLTSSRQQEDLVKSYDLGANSFIRKPVEFEKFVDAIRHVEVYWLMINEYPTRKASS